MPPLITDTEFLKIRGLFRYLVLYVLREKPLHGYAIMKKISKLFDTTTHLAPEYCIQHFSYSRKWV